MKFIKDPDKPLYFYTLTKDNISDEEYVSRLVNELSLPIPQYDDNGNIAGYMPYDIFENAIKDRLNFKYKNEAEYLELEKICMVEQDNGIELFDQHKCVDFLIKLFIEQILSLGFKNELIRAGYSKEIEKYNEPETNINDNVNESKDELEIDFYI